MKKVSFLLGAPCSGKGTQGNLLKKFFDVISAGEILRKKYPKGTEIRNILDNGGLIDTAIIGDAIIFEIENSKKDHIIIDGFPRILEQALLIKNLILKKKIIVKGAIVLECQKKNLIERMYKRTMCEICQTTYVGINKCCNSLTSKRMDDIEDIFEKRYNIYNADFEPIFNLLKDVIDFYLINGEEKINNIHKKIYEILK